MARKAGFFGRFRRRWLPALALLLAVAFAPMIRYDLAQSGDSICRGAPFEGSLENALRPPAFGRNFRAYCYGCIVGLRTYGHSKAVAAMLDAYDALAEMRPELTFVYGEIGFPWGGWFYPHRTHRNGLAFDFMTPMVPTDDNPTGEPPTSLLNGFGYGVALDAAGGRLDGAGQADFDAIKRHLIALDANARARGGRVAQVIIAPDLQDDLRAQPGGGALFRLMRFNADPSWVRHDDHYHVLFDFPCASP